MVRIESHCVHCGLPCLCDGCPNYRVRVHYCDVCDTEGAEYTMDGQDFCEDCAKDYLRDAFSDLTVTEQARLLDIDIEARY